MKFIKHFIAAAITLISLNMEAQTYDSDAQTFFTATGIIDNVQKNAINQLVLDFKSAGIWTKMKALYPFVGSTEATHKYNLKDPRDLDAAYRLTFNGTWTHSSSGADPDGSTAYANTHLIPSLILSLGNTHTSYYSRENTASGTKPEIGQYDDGDHTLLIYIKDYSGNLAADSYSTDNRLVVSNPNSQSFYINNRLSGIHKISRNGSDIVSTTSVSGLLPINQIQLGGMSNHSQYSDRECAFASIGDGLTASEISTFNQIVNNYQCALSRSVETCSTPPPPPPPGGGTSQWITSGNNIYYNAGKVGIGTINMNDANYKLFVETGIRTRKLKVDQQGWPDYVFHKTYKLPTLEEIEKYIKQNNHLPDVPSAKEVQKNGIDLGDNQALLLKKIEELTLIIIGQNKRIKALERQSKK